MIAMGTLGTAIKSHTSWMAIIAEQKTDGLMIIAAAEKGTMTMPRLIDADALMDAMRDEEFQTFVPLDEIDSVIDKAPTINAEPVRHGRWILVLADKRGRGGVYNCTVCNGCRPIKSAYCPDCGAKMDGGARDVE